MNRTIANTEHDVIIIGAGPGGLQLGYYLGRAGRDYLILDRAKQAGSFFEQYPRSRKLISFNKIASLYNDPELQLRWDWNSLMDDDNSFLFRKYSQRLFPTAKEMRKYLDGFAKHFDLRIRFETRVSRISKDADGYFSLLLEGGDSVRCRRLIVATGVSLPHVPNIPGIELAEGYESVSLRPSDYAGARVLILGKGNSAGEIVEKIANTTALVHMASPRPLRLAWETRHPGDFRAQYTTMLDTYQLKLLNSLLDCEIKTIRRVGNRFGVLVQYTHADGEQDELIYDKVIRATGFRFDASLFDDNCRPEMTIKGRFPAQKPTWESTNIDGLYFAGTLTQANDFKRASSAFIDGFRYNSRTLFHFLEQRDRSARLPGIDIPATAEHVTEAVLSRICRASGIWAQFGFLADAITIEPGGLARYSFELPIAYIRSGALSAQADTYSVTFEWGRWDGDVFAIDRHPRAQDAHTSVFLHPVVRRFRGESCIAEHHVLEDLFGMFRPEMEPGMVGIRGTRSVRVWHTEEHVMPLREFFRQNLGA